MPFHHLLQVKIFLCSVHIINTLSYFRLQHIYDVSDFINSTWTDYVALNFMEYRECSTTQD